MIITSYNLKLVLGFALIIVMLLAPVAYANHISSISGYVSGTAHTHPDGPVGDIGTFTFSLLNTVFLSANPGDQNSKGKFSDATFTLVIPGKDLSFSNLPIRGGILVTDNNGVIRVNISFIANDGSFHGSLSGLAGSTGSNTFLGTVQIPGKGLTVHLQGTSGGFIVS